LVLNPVAIAANRLTLPLKPLVGEVAAAETVPSSLKWLQLTLLCHRCCRSGCDGSGVIIVLADAEVRV
jgi:hypothetical protein